MTRPWRMAGLAILVLASLVKGTGHGQREADGPTTYVIQPDSRLDVKTGKSGFLGDFGHEHTIRAGSFGGTIVYDRDNLAASRVELSVEAASLEVVPLGADRKDKPDVEKAMFEEIIHTDRHPTVTFTSRLVSRTKEGVHVDGTLTLEGRSQPAAVDMTLEELGDTLKAHGGFSVKQTDFGIKPYSAAGGAIKVADKVTFDLDVRAIR